MHQKISAIVPMHLLITGYHFKGPIALRHRLSPILPFHILCFYYSLGFSTNNVNIIYNFISLSAINLCILNNYIYSSYILSLHQFHILMVAQKATKKEPHTKLYFIFISNSFNFSKLS